MGGRSETGRVEVRSRLGLDVVLRGHTGTVRSVCFDRGGTNREEWHRSPSHGRRLLSAGAGTFAIRVWSLDEAGGRQGAALTGHSAAIFELRSSGSDGRIASASADGSVRLWDVRQQRCTLSLNAPETGEFLVCHHTPTYQRARDLLCESASCLINTLTCPPSYITI